MLTQKLVRWNPLEGLEKYYNIETLTEDHNELKITFYPDKDSDGNYGKSLQIRCKHPVLFYKKMEQHAWFMRYDEFEASEEECKAGFFRWSFFIVENSTLVQTLLAEAHDTLQQENIQHFIFYSEDDALDIIATSTPLVEWI